VPAGLSQGPGRASPPESSAGVASPRRHPPPGPPAAAAGTCMRARCPMPSP